MGQVQGRAQSEEEKKAVCARLLAAWLSWPELRLGQFLACAIPDGQDAFYTEDDQFIAQLGALR